jgi:beta-1,4-mannosyltransferase
MTDPKNWKYKIGMKIVLFADVNTNLNPYILRFKEALQNQGLSVKLERRIDLKWVLKNLRTCDAIHLHWIGSAYQPSPSRIYSGQLMRKLVDNPLTKGILSVLRLINFTLSLLVSRVLGITLVYTVHNVSIGNRLHWLTRLLERLANFVVFSLCNRIHVHNNYTKHVLETKYNRRAGVTVVPHGNYIGCYNNHVSQEEARRCLNLPKRAFIFLFFGLLRPYKGIGDLIETFSQLIASPNEQARSAKLLIVGRFYSSQHFEHDLLKLVAGNPSIILIPKFISNEDIQLYMNACNMCVFPYKDITTSGAAILALSFGRPIIAPAIASFPELITPDIGLLYPNSLKNEFLSALNKAIQYSWSEATILKYAHTFDWDKLGPQLVTLYK